METRSLDPGGRWDARKRMEARSPDPGGRGDARFRAFWLFSFCCVRPLSGLSPTLVHTSARNARARARCVCAGSYVYLSFYYHTGKFFYVHFITIVPI